jgi:hypothetical protein
VSANIPRLRQMVAQYHAWRISSIVILFSFSYAHQLFDGLLLQIKDKAALRMACLNATQDTPDAYWDDNVHSWITDNAAITRNFVETQFADLPAEDQDAFCRWLEDGHGRELQYDFARDSWFRAMIWADRSHEFPDRMEALMQHMSAEQFSFMQAFCKAYRDAANDTAYFDTCAAMCKMQGDEMDLFQLTKFHVIFPDDDQEEDEVNFFERDPFQTADMVRDGNLLRRALTPIVRKGNPWEIDALDQMVLAYVAVTDHPIQSRSLAANTDALRVMHLYDWSTRDA